MGWYVWDSYNAFKKIQAQDLRIQKLSGDITYLDEVLTSSARLSATTGSKRWEERYLSYVPKLDARDTCVNPRTPVAPARMWFRISLEGDNF